MVADVDAALATTLELVFHAIGYHPMRIQVYKPLLKHIHILRASSKSKRLV
jgi:hypothetical protein